MNQSAQTCETLVVGAGIVGLATAYQLLRARPGLQLAVLEKEGAEAQHQTGHNSGVIHSGIYYKPGSLKATNCRRGYDQLLAFAQEHGIAHEVCGKVVVATSDEEVPRLENIRQRGEANGLNGLRYLSPEEAQEREPYIAAKRALFVPQTGIIDYKEMAQVLRRQIEAAGGTIVTKAKVLGVSSRPGSHCLQTTAGDFEAPLVVTAAGLYSDKLLQLFGHRADYRIVPFRGEYYELAPEAQHMVNHLVYPVPDPAFPFLGVHFTRMVHGGVEAGPNAVLAFAREGYTKSTVHLGELASTLAWPGFRRVAAKYWKTGLGEMKRSWSKAAFTKALNKLMPELKADQLKPGGAGVRAQACLRDGLLIDDFLIEEHPGLVHVANAPSPAATSSLSIGQTVAEIAVKQLDS